MDDLITFLRARLDERAAKADQIHDRQCDSLEDCCYLPGPCDCGVPTVVLADVAAKRKIIAAFVSADEAGEHAVQSQHEWERARALEEAVEMLAQPYAGHAEYQEAWKP